MSARRHTAPAVGWAPPAPDLTRRYARARIRQLRTRNGRGCWIYRVSCRCGWSELVGGTAQIALGVADAHWHAAHRAAWRRPS